MSDNVCGYEGIKALADKTGLRVPDLLALDPKNDPFYCGSAGQRVWADWFVSLWEEHAFPPGTHLRRIHYKLLSLQCLLPDGSPYLNTLTCWGSLENASKFGHFSLIPTTGPRWPGV
jgi:hypothetical protein